MTCGSTVSSLFLLFCCLLSFSLAVHFEHNNVVEKVNEKPWKSCGDSNDKITITNLTISPDPPKAGESLTVVASGSSTETITSGKIHLLLQYGTIALINNTFDLCDLISNVGVKCPLEKGPHTFTVHQDLPADVPKGPYTATVSATDQNGDQLLCVIVKLSVSSKPPVILSNAMDSLRENLGKIRL